MPTDLASLYCTGHLFVFDEDGKLLNIQYLPQPVHQRLKQRIERGCRGKRAAKIKKALTKVVPFAVKEPVGPLLQVFLQRLAQRMIAPIATTAINSRSVISVVDRLLPTARNTRPRATAPIIIAMATVVIA